MANINPSVICVGVYNTEEKALASALDLQPTEEYPDQKITIFKFLFDQKVLKWVQNNSSAVEALMLSKAKVSFCLDLALPKCNFLCVGDGYSGTICVPKKCTVENVPKDLTVVQE